MIRPDNDNILQFRIPLPAPAPSLFEAWAQIGCIWASFPLALWAAVGRRS